MDEANLLHPTIAASLGANATLVAGVQRGDGPELRYLRIIEADWDDPEEFAAFDLGYEPRGTEMITIEYQDTTTGERGKLRLPAGARIITTNGLF